MHVIAGDRNAVELGHIGAGVSDNVRNDPHRWFGRVDIGVADHELLKDVVLNGAVELGLRNPLLFTSDDEKRQDRNDRAVHRHRHRHLVQWNAVEQNFHVLDGIDGNARLANITNDARMVAVIAAMGGKIECNRKALLPGGQIAAIEGVRFLGGRETGILTDGPWAARIHRRTHTARERRKARKSGVTSIRAGVKWLYGYALGRMPG